jgi:hypothetical protein
MDVIEEAAAINNVFQGVGVIWRPRRAVSD